MPPEVQDENIKDNDNESVVKFFQQVSEQFKIGYRIFLPTVTAVGCIAAINYFSDNQIPLILLGSTILLQAALGVGIIAFIYSIFFVLGFVLSIQKKKGEIAIFSILAILVYLYLFIILNFWPWLSFLATGLFSFFFFLSKTQKQRLGSILIFTSAIMVCFLNYPITESPFKATEYLQKNCHINNRVKVDLVFQDTNIVVAIYEADLNIVFPEKCGMQIKNLTDKREGMKQAIIPVKCFQKMIKPILKEITPIQSRSDRPPVEQEPNIKLATNNRATCKLFTPNIEE